MEKIFKTYPTSDSAPSDGGEINEIITSAGTVEDMREILQIFRIPSTRKARGALVN